MTTQDKDLAVAREMLDAEIAAMTKTLAERDALCEAQTRTIHGIPALMRERDAAIAAKEVAESREHALGVQMVALQKRLALATTVVEAVRLFKDSGFHGGEPMIAALAALDAVPGDALATCKPGLQVGVEASGVDVERVSAPAYEGEDEVTP